MKKFIPNLILLILFFPACDFLKSNQTKKEAQTSQNTQKREDIVMKTIYKVQENLKPTKLTGISEGQIADHWSLYIGYINQTNKLNEELDAMQKANQSDTLTYADRRRRLNFEYNGMILHEYYFANLKAGCSQSESNQLAKAIESKWGSFDNWLKDFCNCGKTRGIGWAILYADCTTGELNNHFIQDHENGNVAGFAPILVMDVWEHAYMVDHKSGGRLDYINAFIKNINWPVVEKRYQDLHEGKIFKRF